MTGPADNIFHGHMLRKSGKITIFALSMQRIEYA